MNIGAAILVGDTNRRQDKSDGDNSETHGLPIIRRTLTTLESLFDEIIIINDGIEKYPNNSYHIRIVNNRLKGLGSLGSLYTALCETRCEAVFLLAWDRPFFSRKAVGYQLRYFDRISCEALVTRIGGCLEPLHAIYDRSLRKALFRYLQRSADLSVGDFLSTVDVRVIDLADDDYHRAIRSDFDGATRINDVHGVNTRHRPEPI